MRNGPNGISLFIVKPSCLFWNEDVGISFRISHVHVGEERIRSGIPTKAPSMNAKKTALRPPGNPRSHPKESANFESPNPIHRPPYTYHSTKSGRAAMGPARSATRYDSFV